MASSASTNDASRTLTDISYLPADFAAAKAKRIEGFSDEVNKCITLVKASIKHIQDCKGFPCTSCLERMDDIHTVSQNNNIDRNAVSDGLGIDTDFCKMFAYTWKKLYMLQKIEEADEREELPQDTTHIFTFYNALLLSGWNFTNKSDYFCLQMDKDGCLSLIVDWFSHLVESDKAMNKWVDEVIFGAINILQNAFRRLPTLTPKHHRAVPALQMFGESEDSLTQTMAFMTLAKLVKKEEADKLSTNYTCIVSILSLLEKGLSNPDHEAETTRKSLQKYIVNVVDIHAEELVQSVNDLAINDNNKRLIVEKGGIPILAKLLQHDCSLEEKTSAANGIWKLAFLKENKERLRKEQVIYQNLTENSQSKNDKLRHACEGALFEIYESRPSEGLTHRKTDLKSPKRAPSDSAKSSGHIMLSYKWEHSSTPVMRELKKQLLKRGYNVWMKEDHMMGDKIGAMAEAVENADIVIACITRGYQDSQDCRTEATYAYECNKKIIPVQVNNDFKASGWLADITAGNVYYIDQQAELVSEVLPVIIEKEFAVQKEMVQNVNAAPAEEAKPYAKSEAVIGKEGGIIDVKGCGVFLTIPKCALQTDTNIKVELIPNSISKEVIREDETTICPAVRCTPSGFKLKKPMTISGKHCARIPPSGKTGETPIIVYSSKESIGIDDGTLGDLAEAIETEQHMETLGLALGFSAAEINRYAATNRKGVRTTTKGTQFMLLDWRWKVGAHNQLQSLTEALKKAGLVMLADTHLMNADPNEALHEKVLVDIAEALRNDEDVATLGRALGFSTSALNRYTETNRRGDRITFKGTRDMLLDWRQKISPSDQHQKLKEALTEANLIELSDTYLKEVPRPEDKKVDRREMRPPNCRIEDETIEVEVDEFRTYEFRLPTECLDGKVVGYLAFLPLNMPKSRKPVLNLVIYDNVQGIKESLCEEMDAKGRISRDIERLFFIESSNHNSLEVSCRMDETDDDLRETISLSDLNLEKHFLDFTLDFNHLSTNDSNVKVTLTHGKRSCKNILVVDMKGPTSPQQELNPPPVETQVDGWDSQKVQDWLAANNVTTTNEALKTLNGTHLLQLKKQLIKVPKAFYQSMKYDLEVPYIDILSLAAALDKLN